MKLFGHKVVSESLKNTEPLITPADKKWVDDTFDWLLKIVGSPAKDNGPFVFNEKYFPETFKAKKISPENLLNDLCPLFSVERRRISFIFNITLIVSNSLIKAFPSFIKWLFPHFLENLLTYRFLMVLSIFQLFLSSLEKTNKNIQTPYQFRTS